MPIYLRFCTEKHSIESWMIRLATRSWCSHVGFLRCDENDKPIDTLDSRLKGGIQIRPYGYDKTTAESWFTAPNIGHAYDFGKSLIGRKYDAWDIIAIGFNTRWHKEVNFICSSFIDFCGKVASPMAWTNVHFPSRLITPRDLLASPAIVRVRRVIG